MSNVLRALAGACLFIGIFSAADAAAGGRHVLEPVAWFILEFALLWANARLFAAKGDQRALPSGEPAQRPVWVRQQFAQTVPATYVSLEARRSSSEDTGGSNIRQAVTGRRAHPPIRHFARARTPPSLPQHEPGAARRVRDRGQ
jgi:hypothetical protein